MNAPLLPEILARIEDTPQSELPLAADGVLRYLWKSRFGPMLIEVKDGRSYVNGQVVETVQTTATLSVGHEFRLRNDQPPAWPR